MIPLRRSNPTRAIRTRMGAALLALLLAPLPAPTAAAAAPGLESWRTAANVMAPAGARAERVAGLGWILIAIAAAVVVIVMALLVVGALRRGHEATTPDTVEDVHRDRWAVPLLVGGSAATALVLLVVAGLTFTTMAALAEPGPDPVAEFEVVGKQWWWEIRMDGETIGANELHLPVGEPVRVQLRSDNVIHSFWVPDLAGKRDLIPGHPNELWLVADEPGVYRGICAEFCGRQHARMGFTVVAEDPDDFGAWLERVRSPARAPTTDRARLGQALFQREGCAGCHAVRGTAARGQLGPDLTHLAGRRSLAAATIPNTRGHLAGWIVNPWSVKPGALMPPQQLAGADLQAILDYLGGLE